ncbi:TetR/AcrR family transcriptional regulator [Limoniibacter endophyticus]|uniref:TetR family transcriptional regulator n=1 Tax=Limoniibacter endophyticus TaxID=1565040 RepID=A0A8J3DFD9_9HYPH|nr:TetR/AcrR family transcriptional regulator [Limoniibacter endophyticus]GHC65788.1 TetR family transcriptional regulator [Limoniibacter endophyticus]
MERSRYSIGPVRNPQSQRAVIDAATTLLRTDGYAAFSIDAVARRAGASKPTIYRWWKHKAGLIHEIFDTESENLLSIEETGCLRDELHQLCRNLFTGWRDTASGMALRGLIAEAQQDPRALALLKDEIIPFRLQYPMRVLERAQKRGDIAPSRDLHAAARLLMTLNWHLLLTDSLEEDELLLASIDLVIDGLVVGTTTP